MTVHSALPEHANKKQSNHPRSILVNWPEHDPIIVHHSHNVGPKVDWDSWQAKLEGKDDVQGSTSVAGDTTAGMQEVEQRREQLPRKSEATKDKGKHKDWEPHAWVGDFLNGDHDQSLAEQTGISISLSNETRKKDN